MRKSILLIPLSIFAAVGLAASTRDDEVLAQAYKTQLEFRQGNTDVAIPLVKMLEQAVAKSPNNAALWEALGHANMSKEGALSLVPPDMPALLATAQKARDAYAHSLALRPDNMFALASHGMAGMVVAQFEGDGPGVTAAVEEMNEAVRRAPKSISVRLVRAFTTIYLPVAMRDTDAVVEDLRFILDYTTNPRAEDVLHVMLGDVYAETGKPDAARGEYGYVTGASSFAAEQAKFRFVDLGKGAVAPESIAKVRESTGSRCVTCHAAGIDN